MLYLNPGLLAVGSFLSHCTMSLGTLNADFLFTILCCLPAPNTWSREQGLWSPPFLLLDLQWLPGAHRDKATLPDTWDPQRLGWHPITPIPQLILCTHFSNQMSCLFLIHPQCRGQTWHPGPHSPVHVPLANNILCLVSGWDHGFFSPPTKAFQSVTIIINFDVLIVPDLTKRNSSNLAFVSF